jgi:phosphoribosylanthranilate isomerase
MSDAKIKICGITSPEDARMCEALGVDYLGVIFAGGPRRVTPERAREIRWAAPGTALVGVFVDSSTDEIARVADFCGLDLIQLHGEESPKACAALNARLPLPIVKAIRPGESNDPEFLEAYSMAGTFLFDLYKCDPGRGGGREALMGEAARAVGAGRRVLIAGGIEPGNAREALARTGAFGIDVSRGVERAPGVKDQQALKRLIVEVRG